MFAPTRNLSMYISSSLDKKYTCLKGNFVKLVDHKNTRAETRVGGEYQIKPRWPT